MIEETINQLIKESKVETNKISDGYHTFEELYNHRLALFALICELLPATSWKTRVHSDGTVWDGWFLCGVNYLPGEQISYHFPENWWSKVHAHELKKAPPFDGHTSQDVLERLQNFFKERV